MKLINFVLLCFLTLSTRVCVKVKKYTRSNPISKDPFQFNINGLVLNKNGYVLVSKGALEEGLNIYIDYNGSSYKGIVVSHSYNDMVLLKFEGVVFDDKDIDSLDINSKLHSGKSYLIKGVMNDFELSFCSSIFSNTFFSNSDYLVFTTNISEHMGGNLILSDNGKVKAFITSKFDHLHFPGMVFAVDAKEVNLIFNRLLKYGRFSGKNLKAEFEKINLDAEQKKVSGSSFAFKVVKAMKNSSLKIGDIILCNSSKGTLEDIDLSCDNIKLKALVNTNGVYSIKIIEAKTFHDKTDSKQSVFFDIALVKVKKKEISKKNKTLYSLSKKSSLFEVRLVYSQDITKDIKDKDILISINGQYIDSVITFDAIIFNALKNNEKYITLNMLRKSDIVSVKLELNKLWKEER